MAISLRPLRHADVPVWAALLAAVEAVDRTGEHDNEADLNEELSNPEIEVGKDVVGAFDGAELVGYFGMLPRGVAEGVFKIHLEGSVLPARRGTGIGSRLVEAMLVRANELHQERRPELPLQINVDGLTANAGQCALLASVGLAPRRWTFSMSTWLDAVLPAAQLPAGYVLHAYEPAMDEPLRAAHNTAFLDHPDFTVWSVELWRQFVTRARSFRPELTFVVTPVGSTEIVAYVQSDAFEAHYEMTGLREAYVGKVGALPAHRGRGLASALLAQALHAYQQAGYDKAGLAVDSQNPTGALGIYRRAGFEVESRWTNYAMTIGS